MAAASAAWSVYLARCADGSLYCGIARDVAARIAAHDAGRGARYTAGRGPLAVLLVRRCRDKGAALRLEHAIKQLSRAAKLALVDEPARLAALARRRRPAAGRSRSASSRSPRAARAVSQRGDSSPPGASSILRP